MTGIPTLANTDFADPIISLPDDEAKSEARHRAWLSQIRSDQRTRKIIATIVRRFAACEHEWRATLNPLGPGSEHLQACCMKCGILKRRPDWLVIEKKTVDSGAR